MHYLRAIKLLKMKTKLFFSFILFFLVSYAISQNKSFLDVPYIEVNGYADTIITPNEIYIRITLSESDTKDKVSLEDMEKKLVAGLKTLGIKTEKDLTTSNIQSSFQYHALKQADVLKKKEYNLKVSDATIATRVFIKLEELKFGNAEIEKVSHSEISKIRNACRTKAILNAKEKAIALTTVIGQQVGPALLISDYSNDSDGTVQVAQPKGLRMMAVDAINVELPQIDFEKIHINLSVAVKFALK
jgi:uncharacterized protein YggE